MSSTYSDLKDERQAVTQAILKTNRCIPAGMELFNASGLPPWDVIVKALQGSNYMVLILGDRYGSRAAEDELGYSEREYNFAIENGIPVLAFLSSADRAVSAASQTHDDAERRNLEAFREGASRCISPRAAPGHNATFMPIWSVIGSSPPAARVRFLPTSCVRARGLRCCGPGCCKASRGRHGTREPSVTVRALLFGCGCWQRSPSPEWAAGD